MLLGKLALGDVRFLVRIMRLLRRMSVFVMELLVVRFFVMLSGPSEGFTGKQLDRGTIAGRQRDRGSLHLLVRMAVVVILEIFENVTDVQEGIAIEANVHESGLHAGEDAGDFTFVDAA